MKTFKTRNNKHRYTYILIVVSLTLIMLYKFASKMKDDTIKIIDMNLEEQTNLIIKNNIIPKNIDVDKLLIINKNSKNEIIYTDIDMNYANGVMIDITKKIQDNIFNIPLFKSEILKRNEDNDYAVVPIMFNGNFGLISNIFPKIPVKISYYEHSFGNIDIEIREYGINNAILYVYLVIDIEQKIYYPYKPLSNYKHYKVLIASRIINGIVPSVYGGMMKKSSSIIK